MNTVGGIQGSKQNSKRKFRIIAIVKKRFDEKTNENFVIAETASIIFVTANN